MYCRDLREAGIGNSAHGFVYLLRRHLRDLRSHHVIVWIVGANVTLRDSSTDGLPPPGTRRSQPPLVPHSSLPPLWRWAYFTVLQRALVLAPVPVCRLLAVILAGVQLVLNRQIRRLMSHCCAHSGYVSHWQRAGEHTARAPTSGKRTLSCSHRGIQVRTHATAGAILATATRCRNGSSRTFCIPRTPASTAAVAWFPADASIRPDKRRNASGRQAVSNGSASPRPWATGDLKSVNHKASGSSQSQRWE